MPTDTALPAIKIAKLNVADMTDYGINEFADRHLFNHNAWCEGLCIPLQDQYRCERCGATEKRSLAGQLFGHPGHPRSIPMYTIDDILTAMRGKDKSTWAVFVTATKSLCGEALRGYTDIHRLLFVLSARLVGVAALFALGIIDEQGNVK